MVLYQHSYRVFLLCKDNQWETVKFKSRREGESFTFPPFFGRVVSLKTFFLHWLGFQTAVIYANVVKLLNVKANRKLAKQRMTNE